MHACGASTFSAKANRCCPTPPGSSATQPSATSTRSGVEKIRDLLSYDGSTINDAQAKALSYVHESPKPDSVCANCQLYTGPADAAWGPCALFPGKQVAGAGWCSAWVKRAG